MQDFTKVRALIDYVDALPSDTVFSYADCEKCLLGLGMQYVTGRSNREWILDYSIADVYEARGKALGITRDQFYSLYTGLTDDCYVGRDKTKICALARGLVAHWEAQQLLEEANGRARSVLQVVHDEVSRLVESVL